MAEGLAALKNTVLLPQVGSATHTTRANMATLHASSNPLTYFLRAIVPIPALSGRAGTFC